jgi:anti-anti-sigma factor
MTTASVAVANGGDVVRFVVAGEIDLANAAEVEASITRAISNESTAAVVDLSAVAYIDSAGLRILYALSARLKTLQIGLELVAPVGSPARQVIVLAGLEGIAQLTP